MQFDAGELFLFWSFVFWSFEFVSNFGFRASDLFVVRHLRLDAALVVSTLKALPQALDPMP